MFSGGLDSLAGTIEEILTNKNRIALVTHESTPKNTRLLRELRRQLGEKAGPLKPLHLRVRANKEKRLGKEYTQRTRSFLFASFGVTVAKMMGLGSLRFYENGIVSVNLPVSAQVVGSRATRTTHPRTLSGFETLFSLLGEAPFVVDNPFLWTTKADVVQKIVKASCGEMIAFSSSCAHTWARTNQYTHCGVCSQCIDRRLAVAAAHAEEFDPINQYARNVFIDSRPADDDKMMLAAYLDRATAVDEVTSPADFIATFPQIVDCFPFIAAAPAKVAQQFFDLYKRHAKEVAAALDAIIKTHANFLVQGIVGGGCLLRTLLDSRGSAPVAMPQCSLGNEGDFNIAVIEFRGADWKVIFRGLEISIPDLIGMRYIAVLFGEPGKEFRHSELHLAASPGIDREMAEASLKAGATRGMPATDVKTLRDVKRVLDALVEEKEAARANGDTGRLAELDEREEDLKRYLSATSNKRGEPRLSKGRNESTRVSVIKAITTVRNRLKKSVRSGQFLEHVLAIRPGQGGHLVYSPKEPVVWKISGPDSRL